ncbi:hypothetical protein D3C80_1462490 [compost metagenome]
MNARRRTFWLIFLGAAAGLAVIPEYFFPDEDAAPTAQVASRTSSEAPRPAAAGQPVTSANAPAAAARQSATNPVKADLFPAQNWRVAPPRPSAAEMAAAKAPPPVAPTPMAPPLPFEFIGRLSDGQRTRVFLQSGEKVYTVHPGDVIDNTYRVDRITSTELKFTYLPLHQSQSLAVGSAP